MRTVILRVILGFVLGFFPLLNVLAEDGPNLIPVLRCAPIGFCFCVRPAFESAVDTQINEIRSKLAAQRTAGKLTLYLSVPLSSGNGSSFGVNRDVAASTATRFAAEFGVNQLYVLNPAGTDLPDVAGQRASQGEYMLLWSSVLGGADGYGRDFDAVYFLGPSDITHYVDAQVQGTGRLEKVLALFDKRYKDDSQFKRDVDGGNLNRTDFLRYYGLRGSASFSRGAHDEWNIATAINYRRAQLATEFGISGLLPIWFDGQAVEPGDYQDGVVPGNTTTACVR